MPSVSKAQNRFMAAVASGSIKKKGLSRRKAAEFVVPTNNLPSKVKNGKVNRKTKTGSSPK